MKNILLFVLIPFISIAQDYNTNDEVFLETGLYGLSSENIPHDLFFWLSPDDAKKEKVIRVVEFMDLYNEEVLKSSNDPTPYTNELKGNLNKTFKTNKLNKLFNDVLDEALYFSTNSNFNYYGQDGLAYVWGGKNPKVKMRPVNYNKKPNICQEQIYGMDCSGFIYQIFAKSNMILTKDLVYKASTRSMIKPEYWENALKKYLNSNQFKVHGEFKKPYSELKSGDIILFCNKQNKPFHIGIIFEANNGLVVFESSGSPRKGCEYNKKKGPVFSFIGNRLNGVNYKIIRLSN